jgi:hypothetical protein
MKKLIIIIGLALSLAFPVANAKPVKKDQLSQIGTEVATGKGAKQAKDEAMKAAKKAAKGERAEPQDPFYALDALKRHTNALLAETNVVGIGVSWERKTGVAIIKVFLSGKNNTLPNSLDGIKVKKKDVGRFYAMNITCEQRTDRVGCAGEDAALDQDGANNEAASPRDWQNRPTPIGVSIGTDELTAGTLGCRVSSGCHNYALSNSHVVAAASTTIIQPSLVDGGMDPDDTIGALYRAVPIVLGTEVNNRVDAALFDVDVSAVGTATRSNGYGEPKMTTMDASLNLDVMKYGRSSAMTRGYIDTINATVIVSYSEGEARFDKQMIIGSDTKGVDFTLPGDSGSLVVADGGDNDRRPVGLVFASGKGLTVANPIKDVLAKLQVDIDGEF